ncbi:MAG: hypothetical protein K2N23_02135, partial [Clostridia bacterium]|nr:hypothetical protein [Clostridia bacterium]
DNYRVKNIWSLGRYLKEHSELISLQDYVAKILNKKTILRILGDVIGESISGTYNYYVSKELCEWVFGDNDIEELVNSAETITESQQFVKEVYSYYLNGTANHWGEKALSYNYPKRYRL